MNDENNKKLNEQLIRCLLDDKMPTSIKLKKMDYIIRLGASVDAEHKTGYSLLSLAKIMGDEDVISFLKEKGGKEIKPTKDNLEEFFKNASVDEINKFLSVLPDGYKLECDVDLAHKGLENLPNFSKIVVGGNFVCCWNKLKNLVGAPKEVGGKFDCCWNGITSLKGAPKKVGMSFYCLENKLENLKYKPQKIGEKIYSDIDANIVKRMVKKGVDKMIDLWFDR